MKNKTMSKLALLSVTVVMLLMVACYPPPIEEVGALSPQAEAIHIAETTQGAAMADAALDSSATTAQSLRWRTVFRSRTCCTPIEAETMRWQAMAEAYKGYSPEEVSAMRWQAMADLYRN